MKILCTGDLHMGRRAGRIAQRHTEHVFSATSTWIEIVDLALREKPDLIALTGDVVDRDNRFYEACSPLEVGLKRLADAGIDICAVAGNHDFDVLPRLVDTIGPERFHLLGRNGQWERIALQRPGEPLLVLHGWSFPQIRFADNPLRSYNLSKEEGVLMVGLLHADLNQHKSEYCPILANELRRTPVAIWLLGHVHAPQFIQPDFGPAILYPGSPLALDRGEPGIHGPWMVELDAHSVNARQIPLSKVRYETVSVDGLENVRTREDLTAHIRKRVGNELAGIATDGNQLKHVSFRVRLQGNCSLHRALAPELRQLAEFSDWERDGVSATVDDFVVETKPPLNLQEIARGNDAASVLASLVVALENGRSSAEHAELFRRIQNTIQEVHEANSYHMIAGDPLLNEDCMNQLVLREAYSLLDALVSQKADPPS